MMITSKTIKLLFFFALALVMLPKNIFHAIETYFFGGAACWADRFWFFGTMLVGLAALLLACFVGWR